MNLPDDADGVDVDVGFVGVGGDGVGDVIGLSDVDLITNAWPEAKSTIKHVQISAIILSLK